jgi:hypothetical protein
MQLRGYYQKGKEKLKIEKTTYRKLPCPSQYCKYTRLLDYVKRENKIVGFHFLSMRRAFWSNV